MKLKDAKKIEDIILSHDNKHLIGVYKTKENNNIIFFIDLSSEEIKKLRPPEFNNTSEIISISLQCFSKSNRLYYLINTESEETEIEQIFPQLWVIDTNTWNNYKIADNIFQVEKIKK